MVIILRGISGSGKSTYAQTIKEKEGADIFSTDDFFQKDGEYVWVRSRLQEAHDWNFKRYLRRVMTSVGTKEEGIIVDNTNLRVLEVAPFYRLAEVLEYPVTVITMMCGVETAISRSIHLSNNLEIIWRQYQLLLREEIPPWWNHRVVQT